MVDQGPRRGLGENPGDAANRHGNPDDFPIPLVASQIDREEWPDPRLDVGEEEVQAVQATQRSS